MLDLVAFDLETHVIQPGLQAPPIVVGSAAIVNAWAGTALENIELIPPLFPASQAVDFLEIVLRSEATLVGANIFYDLACSQQWSLENRGRDLMPLIFAKLDRDQVWDVQLAEMLHAIGAGHLGFSVTGAKLPGRYNLDIVVEENTGRRDAKRNDKWRLRFHELEGVPISDWPPEATAYLGDDVINPLDVTLRQLGVLPRRGSHTWGYDGSCVRCGAAGTSALCMAVQPIWNAHDVPEQCRAAWALTLSGAHGFARDPLVIEMVAKAYARTHGPGSDAAFRQLGLIREDGSEDQGVLGRLIVQAYMGRREQCPKCTCPACGGYGDKTCSCRGRVGKVRSASKSRNWINCQDCRGTGLLIGPEVPRAPAGGISTERDTLFESGDDFLVEYAEYTQDAKTETTYLPWLRQDLELGVPITTRFNPLVKTGRVSADGPIQTLKRQPGAWRDER